MMTGASESIYIKNKRCIWKMVYRTVGRKSKDRGVFRGRGERVFRLYGELS